MNEIKHFNIRVYAIIFNDSKNAVLLSSEYALGINMLKFPGGGMHLGEGTIDCLKREAMEEFGQEIEVTGHFYTTDFFQKALFFDDHQLISIYYTARFVKPVGFEIANAECVKDADMQNPQSFFWMPLKNFDPAILTFPIDRVVGEMLKRDRDK